MIEASLGFSLRMNIDSSIERHSLKLSLSYIFNCLFKGSVISMLGKLAYSVFNSQFLFICGFIWGSFRLKNVKMNILNIIKLAEILNLNALSE